MEEAIALLARVLASGARALVRVLAVLMSCVSVRLSLLVLAQVVMMRRLVMMMSGGVMVSGGLVMMLARRMLSHDVYSQPGREGGIAGRNPNVRCAFGNKMNASRMPNTVVVRQLVAKQVARRPTEL